MRGIRPIERQAEKDRKDGDDDGESGLVRDYCAAVRAALTDDGLPPLVASGLKLHDRLVGIAESLDRAAARAGSLPGGLKRLQHLLRRGWRRQPLCSRRCGRLTSGSSAWPGS